MSEEDMQETATPSDFDNIICDEFSDFDFDKCIYELVQEDRHSQGSGTK